MKIKLSTVLSVLVCAVFIAASVCVGAYRGWSADRTEALASLSDDGGLHALLETRALDAANLAVVAARHLPANDTALHSLRDASALLLAGHTDMDLLLTADETITAVSQRFARELPELSSVQASKRDRAYISVLTSVLSQKTSLAQNCGLLVEDFNQRLNSSLTGRLAMLLGVEPLSGIAAEYAIEPRYPDRIGVTTDAAGVLSRSTIADLDSLDNRLDDVDALRLQVVTVDFLDAADAEEYASALFRLWKLDDEDILLLLAVGEDRYALYAGKDAEKLLPSRMQAKLLAAYLEEPFLLQEYDAALAAYVPVLADEISKACGEHVTTDGLFGTAKENVFAGWASKLQSSAQTLESAAEAFLKGRDSEQSISLIKVFVTIVLLMVIFGSRKKKKGGIPFGKILAVFALFKLWKRR